MNGYFKGLYFAGIVAALPWLADDIEAHGLVGGNIAVVDRKGRRDIALAIGRAGVVAHQGARIEQQLGAFELEFVLMIVTKTDQIVLFAVGNIASDLGVVVDPDPFARQGGGEVLACQLNFAVGRSLLVLLQRNPRNRAPIALVIAHHTDNRATVLAGHQVEHKGRAEIAAADQMIDTLFDNGVERRSQIPNVIVNV